MRERAELVNGSIEFRRMASGGGAGPLTVRDAGDHA